MADPVCHATQGALMMVAPFISRIRKRVVLWTLVCVGAVLGDSPTSWEYTDIWLSTTAGNYTRAPI